jgi:hypothetical protein
MTQPSFVPIAEADQVRPARRLRQPDHAPAPRPAELRNPRPPMGSGFGSPGPDQGFALTLGRRISGDLQLKTGEHRDDVVLGLSLIAARRAALFGRAPCIHDLKLAGGLWGYFDPDPPVDLLAERREAFSGVAHDYFLQRALVERQPEVVLRWTLAQAVAQPGAWRSISNIPVD